MRTATLLLVGAFATFSSVARGQEAASVSDGVQSSEASNGSQSAAEKAFGEAEASYARGDVSGALRAMQSSYDLSQKPELLFNLGELHRELGHCDLALQSYRRYLDQALTGTMRSEAAHSVSVLEPSCGEQSIITKPNILAKAPPLGGEVHSRAPSSPATSYWTTTRKLGWTAVGAAVLAGAGATYLAVRAASAEHFTEDRIKAIQASASSADGYGEDDRAREAAGRRDARWARVLVAGTAGFAAAGITLLVVGTARPENQRSSFTVGCAPGVFSASYSGSF